LTLRVSQNTYTKYVTLDLIILRFEIKHSTQDGVTASHDPHLFFLLINHMLWCLFKLNLNKIKMKSF